MKHFLSITILICALATFTGYQTHAQIGTAKQLTVAAGDTIIASSSKDTATKIIQITGGYSAYTVQLDYTKTAGTTNLKLYTYKSATGVNYKLVDSTAAFTNSTSVQTVLLESTSTGPVYYKYVVREPDGSNNTQTVVLRWYYVLKPYTKD